MSISREVLYSILEYPMVTYITLLPSRVFKNAVEEAPSEIPNVQIAKNPQQLAPILNSWQANDEFVKSVDFERQIVIIATNLEILDLKYRTVRITAIGKRQKNHVEFLVVRSSYFYTNHLYFEVFDYNGKSIPINTRVYSLNKQSV